MEIQIIKKTGKLKVGAIKKVSDQVGDLFVSRGIAKKVGDAIQAKEDKVVYSTVKINPESELSLDEKAARIAAKLNAFKAADDKIEKRRLRKELDELKK